MYRCIATLLAGLIPVVTAGESAQPKPNEYPETAVCGTFREPMAFWSWSRMAGRPDPSVARALPNAQRIEHETRDGRTLRGYRLDSPVPPGVTRSSVLVAQGNAMLADHLLGELQTLARKGLDVWIFDYRGYGGSEGRARLQAIVGDYLELHHRILDETGEAPALYGISFGGIVLLNAVGSGAGFRRAVIDGSPARVSGFGCPNRFDPAKHFPDSYANVMVIAGHRDNVVPVEQTRELLDLATANGGKALERDDFHHPFMDGDPAIRRERLTLISDYLLGE